MSDLIIESEYESKINLCVLRTQLGKTYQAIKRIIKEIELDLEEGRSIHIVHTMNTLLNNKQFVSRLSKILRKYGENSVVILSSDNSSNNKGKSKKYVDLWDNKLERVVKFPHFKSLDELKLSITVPIAKRNFDDIPKVIVMCCNKTRFDNMFGSDGLVEFLEECFQNNKNNTDPSALYIQRVFAYIDEMHEYINENLRQKLERVSKFEVMESIIGFTATPDPIFIPSDPFWSKIRLIELTNYNDKNYVGASDQDWIVKDNYIPFQKENYKKPGAVEHEKKAKDVLGFLEFVIESHHQDIFKPKSRIFAPGHTKEDSHNRIMKLIFKYSPECVIVILNSKNKMLVFQDQNQVQHTRQLITSQKQSGELPDNIYDILVQNNLENRPVCYTGMLCIGMGQTLVSKKFGRFTSAILSHLDLKNDAIYQLFGRLTGNSRDWYSEFVMTSIYCPSIIMNRCRAMEDCASMMVDYQGKTIDREIYRQMLYSRHGQDCLENLPKEKKQKSLDKKSQEEDDYLGGAEWFDTKSQVENFYKETGAKGLPPFKPCDENGFELGSISKNLEILTKDKIEVLIKGKKTAKFFTKGSKIGTYNRLLYPYYTNPNDNTTLKYCVRWLKKVKNTSGVVSQEESVERDSVIVEPKVSKKRRSKIVSADNKNKVLQELEMSEEEFKNKLQSSTVLQLQVYCKSFGIPKAGKKSELVTKLLDIFQ